MTYVSGRNQSEPTPSQDLDSRWPIASLIVFRFSFSYFVLSAWFWIFNFADKSTAFVGRPYLALWRPIVTWTATYLLRWGNIAGPNFIHDTHYLFALLFCFLIVSILITALWSAIDRGRPTYANLHRWLRVLLRYVLAYLMLHYGMDKIFLLQFTAPGLNRLLEPFGEYSPSSLMWAFIGSSIPYTIFGGLAEIAGALLLLSRRTTTLGALITFAVMFNVTVMDFSYDVSVKLFSLNLLLMAAYLVWPDSGRLLSFFVFNRATQCVSLRPIERPEKLRRVAGILKVVLVVYLLLPLILRDFRAYRTAHAESARSPLYGIYEVKDFSMNGEQHPPLVTDGSRWRYLIFDSSKVLTVMNMDDSIISYSMTYNSASRQVRVEKAEDESAEMHLLIVNAQEPGTRTLTGSINGQQLMASMHKIDLSRFPLLTRGFHWINESSYIR